MEQSLFKQQITPLALVVAIFGVLVGVLMLEIKLLNQFTAVDVLLRVRWFDVLIGLTVYFKTSIDFAIYIGNLMSQNRHWKSRVAIEVGTALGNGLGTMAVLVVWVFFKDVKVLLMLMILLASLVLFKLAEDSLAHLKIEENSWPTWLVAIFNYGQLGLGKFNRLTNSFLKYIVPRTEAKQVGGLSFWPLVVVAFTVPFILGLDDFAGYISLFNVVNVFGFSIGVFLGHMILNIFLYLSPDHTIRLVKNQFISLVGSLVFIGLAIWGLVEVVKLIGF